MFEISVRRVHEPRGKLNVGDKQETVDLIEGDVECRSYDSITVSSTWELTLVSMRYSQGDGVYTSLVSTSYCTHVFVFCSLSKYCVLLCYPRHGHVLYGTIIIKTMCVNQLYLQG